MDIKTNATKRKPRERDEEEAGRGKERGSEHQLTMEERKESEFYAAWKEKGRQNGRSTLVQKKTRIRM